MKLSHKYILYILILGFIIASVSVVGFVYSKYVNDITVNGEISLTPASLTATVAESVSGNVFTYQITNDSSSSMPCFIRFALVINWGDGKGNLWSTPVKAGDYELSYNGVDINKIGDYYYYKFIVNKGSSFSFNVTQNTKIDDDDYILDVTVLAEAIQTVPESVVTDAWGVSYNGGVLQVP